MTQEETFSHEVGTKLLFEDDQVRVWLLELAPGEATIWHEHECDYAFVVTQSGTVQCEYTDGQIESQLDDPVGSSQYRGRDTPHRLVNIGTKTYQNIVIEFKNVLSVNDGPRRPAST